MAVTLVKPREDAPSPLPDNHGSGQVILLSATGAARGIVFKVRDWDPHKHPRGYKGLFTDTPDKIEVRNTSPGDVFATKSGKVFRVEGHGSKGAKVSSVDPDTGEVLAKGTVVAHNIQVARIVGGKGIGTQHPISELDPGTYVQHPKSGKRFVIAKHGNWTTIYPVDSQGERVGKHTVLPKDTQMVVTSKQAGGQVTPQVAQQVQQAQTQAQTQVQTAPKTNTNPLGVRVGDNVIGKNTGTIYEVKQVDSQGVHVEDDQGKLTVIDPAQYEKHIQEVMPEGLKRPPRPYADNVGKDTKVVIREVVTGTGYVGSTTKFQTRFEVVRQPTGDVLGTASKIGEARRMARTFGEAHEAVSESRVRQPGRPEVGDVMVTANGSVGKVEDVQEMKSWYGPGVYYRIRFQGQRYTFTINQSQSGSNAYAIPDVAAAETALRNNGDLGMSESLGDFRSISRSGMEQLWAMVSQEDPKTTRAARPQLYIDALRHDFDPSELIGKTKGEALGTLRKLGYGEITPREPNMTKYVNANGKRLHIHNKGGVVTAIDEIQRQATKGGGKGFHGQLQAVLDSGGDVRTLDPSHSPYPEERTSHTRQILYDMALGKQNGVEKIFDTGSSTIKVKSDAAYRTEIHNDASFPAKASFASQVTDPGVNVPVSQDVMQTHWGVPPSAGVNAHLQAENEHEATAAIAVGERNGVAAAMKAQSAQDFETAAKNLGYAWEKWQSGDHSWMDQITSDPATRDYLVNTLDEIAPRGKRQWDFRQTEIDRRADALYEQAVTDEIAKRRKAEGTVAVAPGGSNTFELPLWDEIDMKDQDLYEVESLVQNAPANSQTPMFASGGIVRDGVLYARMDRGRHVLNARVPLEFDQQAATRLSGAQRVTNSKHPNPSGSSFNRTGAGHMLLLDEGGGKRIEYVPHGGGQEAPTNQRGRLTLEGYSPAEAMQRLQDLGIIHEAEEQVPFSSIMRSERRYGVVSPLHSDYVSGEAPLPKIPTAIVHGTSNDLAPVLDSGGLLPINERFKVGIPLNGTIPLNDIKGGVDHVVFAAMSNQNSPYSGYGSGANIVYKDSAYLRRDILITDRAFGSGSSRYPAYRNYMNGFRRQAGEASADVNIYEPLSPKARQLHIDSSLRRVGGHKSNLGPHDNEWDLGGGVPIEDMAVIVVGDQSAKRRVDEHLDRLLREGRISERPEVDVGSVTSHAVR